jgi:hypothetical protein
MLIHSAVITGSVQLNNTDVSGITNVAGFASTGSNQFNGNQSISGSITSNGTITAQTLVVQTITSSIEFVTGSTKNGSLAANTHQFTGSVLMSGSLTVASVSTPEKISTIYGVNVATTSGNGGNLTIKAGGGSGAGNTAGNLYLGFGRGNSSALNGSMYFGVAQATDSVGLDATYMAISSSGYVGIGTTTPTTILHISSGTPILRLTTTTQNTPSGVEFGVLNGGTYNYAKIDVTNVQDYDTNLRFWTAAATSTTLVERMRITKDGIVFVGTTSLVAPGTFNAYSNNSTPAGRMVGGPSMADGNIALMVDKYSTTNSTSQWFLGFTTNNQSVASGVITANGASQAAFGSWSDRRLKENIVDLPNQLSNILALRPVEFDYIESEGGGHQVSFIAQEFEEIYPDAIGERPDGMKTLTGWGKTEAILVKAIQELKAEIDILKQQ